MREGPASVVVRSHPDCQLHQPGLGHPESPARLRTVLEALGRSPRSWVVDGEVAAPDEDEVIGVLEWIHDPAYIERFRQAVADAPTRLDSEDCGVSCGSFQAAITASGLALRTALDVANGRVWRAFLATRPPSHHAERDRARGYCFFNGVALAAEVLVRAWNTPVLIVDFDAHHGNGTQRHFWSRGDVGYVSVHRYPGFPGTGAGDEEGEGEGRGWTRNVPLAAGADDELFCRAFEDAVEEIAGRLRPAAILVSAGFDAHVRDPVGGMRVTDEGYKRLTSVVVQVAESWAQGRVISFLEGGFDPASTAESARIHVEELASDTRAN
jgi:acetoin utilization deacetylase AcuC-like enzyme